MAFALAPEQKRFLDRMVRSGKFQTKSEVVSEALRRMAAADLDFLAPPALTHAQIERIYGPDPAEDERESRFGRAAFAAVRQAARRLVEP